MRVSFSPPKCLRIRIYQRNRPDSRKTCLGYRVDLRMILRFIWKKWRRGRNRLEGSTCKLCVVISGLNLPCRGWKGTHLSTDTSLSSFIKIKNFGCKRRLGWTTTIVIQSISLGHRLSDLERERYYSKFRWVWRKSKSCAIYRFWLIRRRAIKRYSWVDFRFWGILWEIVKRG